MLENALKSLQAEWEVIKTASGNAIKKDWKPACDFLLHAIDVLVIAAEQNMTSSTGADKKAAVLAAFSTMFSTVILPLMPIYLQPFAGKIQSFFMTVIVSSVIDYTVGIFNRLSPSPVIPVVPTPLPVASIVKKRAYKKRK